MLTSKLFIGGEWLAGETNDVVKNPYNGDVVREISLAGAPDIERAISSAVSAFRVTRNVPAYKRAELLLALREGVRERRDEMARSIALEAGKPIRDARTEVDRALNVLLLSAEEARRIGGETMPLDLAPGSDKRWGLTRRVPVGPIAAITPFNFPINLGMHKVGPALAAGNSVIWKPSLLAPGAALIFAELFADAAGKVGFPAAALSVVTARDEFAEALVTDPRIRMLSFTGSDRVGWALRSKAGTKKVALELGGNAAAVVAADADIDYAVKRCVAGGFGYAGQMCISVQRILVQASVYEQFRTKLLSAVSALKVGDPLDDTTDVGPVVSDKEASRIERWIGEAQAAGSKIEAGGHRQNFTIQPTVVTSVSTDAHLWKDEAFGPLVTVTPYNDWNEALTLVNESRFGIQVGLFTNNLSAVLAAFDTLDIGGVIVNDIPTYRADSMPYGGIKDSGLGREGVRYAIEEMTEMKFLAFCP